MTATIGIASMLVSRASARLARMRLNMLRAPPITSANSTTATMNKAVRDGTAGRSGGGATVASCP